MKNSWTKIHVFCAKVNKSSKYDGGSDVHPQSCFSWNLLTRATRRYLVIIIIMTTPTMSTTMRTTTVTNFYSLTKENHKEPYSVHCCLRVGRSFCEGVRCRLLTSQVQCLSSIITNHDTHWKYFVHFLY